MNIEQVHARVKAAAREGLRTPATSVNSDLKIGARIRAARQRRGMSLEQMAEETGLTKGFISQVERNLTSVSVASLVNICNAIGLRIGALFEPARRDLIRHADRPRINFGGVNVTEFMLTPANQAQVRVIQSQIGPGGGSGDEPYSLNGEAEFVHVISGELEIAVHGDTYLLGAGDSLTFSPRDPHNWRNPSDTETLVLWVLAPSPW
jgi:transcriptional regulator with XRE-family HTH domain